MKKSIQNVGLLTIITAGFLGIDGSAVSAQDKPNIVYIPSLAPGVDCYLIDII